MKNDLIRRDYEVPTSPGARHASRGNTVCLQVIAVSLVFSLAIALTAVSIGIARAGSLHLRPSQTTFLG